MPNQHHEPVRYGQPLPAVANSDDDPKAGMPSGPAIAMKMQKHGGSSGNNGGGRPQAR